MASKQINIRLKDKSQEQLRELIQKTGMTQSMLMALAIDKLHDCYIGKK